MDENQPERLLNEHYLSLSSPFRIFRHHIGTRIEVHWHEFFEMALVIEGSGIHVLNGRKMPLAKGMLFMVTPADFHEIIPDPGHPIELYNVIFSQHVLRQEMFQWLFQSSDEHVYALHDEGFDSFRAEFSRMWQESEHWQTGSDWVVQGALERVLIDLARLGRTAQAEGSSRGHLHPSIRSAVTYIQHHFREPLSLDSVAKHVILSSSYFSECFRKQMGVTFQIFLQEQRLQFANSLLQTTNLPVTEVCFASGFRTLSHFERTFKKKYGCTPRELRVSPIGK